MTSKCGEYKTVVTVERQVRYRNSDHEHKGAHRSKHKSLQRDHVQEVTQDKENFLAQRVTWAAEGSPGDEELLSELLNIPTLPERLVDKSQYGTGASKEVTEPLITPRHVEQAAHPRMFGDVAAEHNPQVQSHRRLYVISGLICFSLLGALLLFCPTEYIFYTKVYHNY